MIINCNRRHLAGRALWVSLILIDYTHAIACSFSEMFTGLAWSSFLGEVFKMRIRVVGERSKLGLTELLTASLYTNPDPGPLRNVQ